MIVTVLGWSGAAALLVAYALVSRQRVAGDGFTYQALNVYGIGVVALRRVALRRAGRGTQAPAA